MKLHRFFLASRSGARILLLLFFLVVTAAMATFDFGEKFKRVSMCAFFCAVLYVRDQESEERWLPISIIVSGTLLSMFWSL